MLPDRPRRLLQDVGDGGLVGLEDRADTVRRARPVDGEAEGDGHLADDHLARQAEAMEALPVDAAALAVGGVSGGTTWTSASAIAWMRLNSTSVPGFWKNAPASAWRYQLTMSSAVLAIVWRSLSAGRPLVGAASANAACRTSRHHPFARRRDRRTAGASSWDWVCFNPAWAISARTRSAPTAAIATSVAVLSLWAIMASSTVTAGVVPVSLRNTGLLSDRTESSIAICVFSAGPPPRRADTAPG